MLFGFSRVLRLPEEITTLALILSVPSLSGGPRATLTDVSRASVHITTISETDDEPGETLIYGALNTARMTGVCPDDTQHDLV